MNVPPQQMYHRYPAGAPHRSPHGSTPRRGPGPMMATSHPQAAAAMSQAQMQAQMQAQQMAALHQQQELAKRRSRKPTDKTIPDGIEDIIGGDLVQQYRSLRDLERRTDATMMRKRLDVQDAVLRNIKRNRTLRVWVSNTVENQPWQDRPEDDHDFDFSGGPEGSYRVKIEGRLLEEEDDHDERTGVDRQAAKDDKTTQDGQADKVNGVDGHAQGRGQSEAMDLDSQALTTVDRGGSAAPAASTSPPQHRFSHFFKSITIQFHGAKMIQPDGTNQIEWRKPAPPNVPHGTRGAPVSAATAAATDFDALFFERKSDEDINITIGMVRDENPERFWVSKELGEIIDRDEDDRARVVMGIYEYVKALGLQEGDDKRGFRCDDKLRNVFQRDFVFFHQVPELIVPHLKSLPPIEIPYTIRVGKEYHQEAAAPQPDGQQAFTSKKMQETIYDIQVAIDDPLKTMMTNFIRGVSSQPAPSANPAGGPSASTQPAGGIANNPALTLRRLASLDEHTALCTQALIQSRNKLEFLEGFSRDPAMFLYRWLSSQKRDLELILGEGVRSSSFPSTTGGGGGAEGATGEGAGDEHTANGIHGLLTGLAVGADDDEWRRGGNRSLWGREEVREAVMSLVTSTTMGGYGGPGGFGGGGAGGRRY